MVKDLVETNDGIKGTLKTTGELLERKIYVVASEHGLLKRGTHYPKGSTVELDIITAQSFLQTGEISQ